MGLRCLVDRCRRGGERKDGVRRSRRETRRELLSRAVRLPPTDQRGGVGGHVQFFERQLSSKSYIGRGEGEGKSIGREKGPDCSYKLVGGVRSTGVGLEESEEMESVGLTGRLVEGL